MSKNFDLIKLYVKDVLSKESTGHDYFHSHRVMKNAVQIAKDLAVNLDMIKVCSLTHDLIDKKVTNDIELSKKKLRDVLIKANFSDKEIMDVFLIIENISFSKGSIPDSLEGKIVQDADRLDALGAIGISRTFAYGGSMNRVIYNPGSSDNSDSIFHFYDKLFKLRDLMNTDKAKQIALKRIEFMELFLTNFYQEWDGIDLD